MPKNNQITATGYQQRILAANPAMNRNYAKRLAYRAKRQHDWQQAHDERVRAMTIDEIYEQGLRILGIYTDTTPRQAAQNLQEATA